ncbi:hypothetical protein SEUCBS139899_003967 [Sporothrix eucalyptigena]|uniref:C2H2-type domain-containing protein n=1 Tax=Sporothrix eucalyptigena TaxID=1812306 RepID=A0ABP0AJX3_9PEZI
MKRAREPEELPSPPSSLSLPGIDIDEAVDSDARSTPAPDTQLYANGARGRPIEPRAKIASLSLGDDEDEEEGREQAESAIMSCLLHRERMDFPTYDAYEAHYTKEHLNRCIECRRNFPSPLYLSLHGDEWHDPFVAVKRDKGEHTYGCFVEGCERKCGSPDKRRRHLIDKHSFPHNFFFSITQYGIDGRQSLLNDDGRRQHHRRQSSTSTVTKKDFARRRAASINMTGAAASPLASKPFSSDIDAADDDGDDNESDEGKDEPEVKGKRNTTSTSAKSPKAKGPKEAPDVVMDDLTGAMSSMTFIPRSVRFGRGGKSGFARR